MRVDVALLPCAVSREGIAGRTVVVIDVLRAGCTVATALTHGAERVVPVRSLRAARRLAAELAGERKVLLCGERRALKPSGFHLGNSPLEFTAEQVRGKVLILTTTNATRVVARLRSANAVLGMAGLVNAPAVGEWLAKTNRDVLLVCAGTNGGFSMEDAFAAGVILLNAAGKERLDLSDSASVCMTLAERYLSEPEKLMQHSTHAAYLRSIGFSADVEYCSRIGSCSTVPVWDGADPGGFVAHFGTS